MMDEVIDDKAIFCTRAKEYVKSNETVNGTGARKKNFFLCKDQHVFPPSWKDEVNSRCDKCFKYELTDILPYGVLSTAQEVLRYMITMKGNHTGLATDVVLQWIFCNIYPKKLRTGTPDLHSMMTEYNALKKRLTSKKN